MVMKLKPSAEVAAATAAAVQAYSVQHKGPLPVGALYGTKPPTAPKQAETECPPVEAGEAEPPGKVEVTGDFCLVDPPVIPPELAHLVEPEPEAEPPPLKLSQHCARLFLPPACVLGYYDLRTQKAKSILWCSSVVPRCMLEPFIRRYKGFQTARDFFPPTPDQAIRQRIPQFFPHQAPPEGPSFARPCPTRPRHGFVESRVVQGAAETAAIILETLRADPEGEIVFTPLFSADFSAVVTNAGVTWGRGNAGATDGSKGGAFLIPAPVEARNWRRALVSGAGSGELSSAGITGVPYLELVTDGPSEHHAFHVCPVQLRDGPSAPVGRNFIPRKTKVRTVVVLASHPPSLLKWEKQVAELSTMPGAAVQAFTYPLSSHYAVHCIQRRVPFITDRMVSTGDLLCKENATSLPSRADLDKLQQVIHGVLLAPSKVIPSYWGVPKKTASFRDIEHAGEDMQMCFALLAVGSLHASPLWPWGHDHSPLLRLRGVGIAMALRLLAMACLAEARHFKRVGPGRHGWASSVPWGSIAEGHSDLPLEFLDNSDMDPPSRDIIYRLAFDHLSITRLVGCLPGTIADFECEAWEGSFGGRSWGAVARATLTLALALQEFLDPPAMPAQAAHLKERRVAWRKCVEAWNQAINAAHNNGPALGKWLRPCPNTMRRTASAPALGFLHTLVPLILYEWPGVEDKVGPGRIVPAGIKVPPVLTYDEWKALAKPGEHGCSLTPQPAPLEGEGG